jgi:predicted DNA binding CopG/RHH family protein
LKKGKKHEASNLRMPVAMVNALKTQANKQDVPYQSYMKMLLARALNLKIA